MIRDTIYLEAANPTQDLLDIKWTLLSAGYTIGSTWHESTQGASSGGAADHWNRERVEQLQFCDTLVVLGGEKDCAAPEVSPEVSMMAGFALARGLRVIWIGSPVRGLCDCRAVLQFDTAEDFRRQVLQETNSRTILTDQRLAA